jgi:hypothetical protein
MRTCFVDTFQSAANGLELQEMSQYPPPYPPQHPSPYYPPNLQPQYLPYAGPSDYLQPARQAGVIMFIVGGILGVLAVCNILQSLTMPMSEQLANFHRFQQTQNNGDTIQFSDEEIRHLLIFMRVLISLLAIAYIGFAVGVRHGGKVSTVLALILTSVITIVFVFMLLATIVQSLASPLYLLFSGFLMIPTGIMALLIIRLIQSLRVIPRLDSAQQQYLAQYWQYQQQMQAIPGYGYAPPPQGGHGYAPQTTPPPLPVNPNTPPPPPTGG